MKTRNKATPITISGVTSGNSINAFDAFDARPRQRCRPIAIATPIGVAISMLSTASLSVFFSAVRKVSSCHTDDAGSPQYHRNDGDWNADRLLPELNEIRIATSTGTQRPQDVQPGDDRQAQGRPAGAVAPHVATAR